MDVLTVTFITACTALVSAAAGPAVSVIVSTRQIRASLVSSNRERWTEALRDCVAEYVGLTVSAAMLRKALHKDPLTAIRENPDLARLVERVALARNKIFLMVNPTKVEHSRLCATIEAADLVLLEDTMSLERLNVCVVAITNAARIVLRGEWARVKSGG
jgi:hypothetical protein